MIIVLIGYMASGKSTIGKVLAEKLSYDFMDLDEIIERKEQNSISDIFKFKGEIHFRKLETHYLETSIMDQDKLVLSLGGGTPCYGNNMTILQNADQVRTIYLKASLNTLIDRLKNEKSKRPLISHLQTNEELTEFVAKHLFERRQFYEQADFTITTDNKALDAVASEILTSLNQ